MWQNFVLRIANIFFSSTTTAIIRPEWFSERKHQNYQLINHKNRQGINLFIFQCKVKVSRSVLFKWKRKFEETGLLIKFGPFNSLDWIRISVVNKPISMYQYSNMAVRLSGKYVYLLFSLYPSLFWESRDKIIYTFDKKA